MPVLTQPDGSETIRTARTAQASSWENASSQFSKTLHVWLTSLAQIRALAIFRQRHIISVMKFKLEKRIQYERWKVKRDIMGEELQFHVRNRSDDNNINAPVVTLEKHGPACHFVSEFLVPR